MADCPPTPARSRHSLPQAQPSANLAIEEAYMNDRASCVLLGGSQFEKFVTRCVQIEIRLPIDLHKDSVNELLLQLRGPWAGPGPDIVDSMNACIFINHRSYFQV